jgi:hypothetical protein
MEYKRLTNRTPDGIAYTEIPLNESHIMENQCFTGFVADRLVAYEDSGLSPEEVQEIARAKAEGRLVVLPCKVGDTVFLILETFNDTFEIEESVVTRVFLTLKASYISCWIDCPGICNSLEYKLSDFGKTVFLSREEAEQALKALGGDNQ